MRRSGNSRSPYSLASALHVALTFYATMQRRNFLSGLMAAPLALKARFARFFVCKPAEPCGAPIFEGLVPNDSYELARNQSISPRQRQVVQLLTEGKSLKEVADLLGVAPRPVAPLTVAFHPVHCAPARCSLPRGHKGPHMLLNPH